MGCKKSKLDGDQNGGVIEGSKHQPVRTDQTVYVRDPTSYKPHIVSSVLDGGKHSVLNNFAALIFVVSEEKGFWYFEAIFMIISWMNEKCFISQNTPPPGLLPGQVFEKMESRSDDLCYGFCILL